MKDAQIARAQDALGIYVGVIRNLHVFHPWMYEATSMIPVDYLIHPVERKLKASWLTVRETFRLNELIVPPTVFAKNVKLGQVQFHGGLFVTSMEQIKHDLQSFEIMDELRGRKSHPLSLLRYAGAKLMCLKDVYGVENLPADRQDDSANIIAVMAKSFDEYYNSNDWFGVGNTAWKRS